MALVICEKQSDGTYRPIGKSDLSVGIQPNSEEIGLRIKDRSSIENRKEALRILKELQEELREA